MKSFYLENIKIEEYKNIIGENIISSIDENNKLYQWTIILGVNGTGKTNILKAIANLNFRRIRLEEKKNLYVSNGINLSVLKTKSIIESKISNQYSLVNQNLELKDIEEFKTWGYSYSGSSGVSFEENEIDFIENFKIYAYGVTRKASNNNNISNTENEDSNFKTLFDTDEKLINLNEWLLQTDYAAKKGLLDAKKRLKIIKGIITSEIFPEISNFRFTTNNEFNNYVEFKTIQGWFRFEDLAYGYQSTLSWIIDFSKKMFDRYPKSLNPIKEAAIVLIDEIDLHLHPQWQRSIIKILSDLFPNTQFIVTTHSPLVIQSLSEANVYVLNKSTKGVTIDKLPNKSFVGWSVEDILYKIMGLSSKVKTDEYLSLVEEFDNGLDTDNSIKVKNSYEKLMAILPENDFQRKMFEGQFNQFSKVK